jgi:hypothetical protein
MTVIESTFASNGKRAMYLTLCLVVQLCCAPPLCLRHEGWMMAATGRHRLVPVRDLEQEGFLERAPDQLEPNGEAGPCETARDRHGG